MPIAAFSEYRNVKITYGTGGSIMPISAYKAVIDRVQQLESKVQEGLAPEDYSAETMVIYSDSRYRTHVFEVTTDFTAGEYIFDYQETVPSVDDITPPVQ